MTLTRFLAEVGARARTPIPADVDPVGIILTRVGVNPHTIESTALWKATLAVIATEGDMGDADLWALSKDALALLDAFARTRLSGRYTALELQIYGQRLRGRVRNLWKR
jgi:hypothetical protein